MTNSPSKYQLGFSLIEILMVLMLISVLAAIAIPSFVSFSNDSRAAVTQEKLATLKNAIIGDGRRAMAGRPTNLGYERNCNALPTTLADLITQPGAGVCAAAYNPFSKRGWRGPYVSNTDANYNRDGWGTLIQYNSGARTLTSYGPNAAAGGGDDISVSF